jgi:hypothetical protein
MTDGPEEPSHLAGLFGAGRDHAGKSRAAGIYGAIITAAILDTAGNRLPTDALVIAVVVTLVVYWLAEEYAELVGEHVAGGRLPTWSHVRAGLVSTWPMVSTSFAPLLVLVLAHVAGASALIAANVGLVAAVVLLTVYAWSAGRAAQFRGRQLVVVTSVAATLGLVMIALKDLVLLHFH